MGIARGDAVEEGGPDPDLVGDSLERCRPMLLRGSSLRKAPIL